MENTISNRLIQHAYYYESKIKSLSNKVTSNLSTSQEGNLYLPEQYKGIVWSASFQYPSPSDSNITISIERVGDNGVSVLYAGYDLKKRKVTHGKVSVKGFDTKRLDMAINRYIKVFETKAKELEEFNKIEEERIFREINNINKVVVDNGFGNYRASYNDTRYLKYKDNDIIIKREHFYDKISKTQLPTNKEEYTIMVNGLSPAQLDFFLQMIKTTLDE